MIAPIRLDRFSPNFDQAEYFGITRIQPFSMYASLYPLPPQSVANLAYFFEYKYADGRDPNQYIQPMTARVGEWKGNRNGDLIKRYGAGSELTIKDTRIPGEPRNYRLTGVQREIYDFCDEIQSASAIARFAADHGSDSSCVEPFLQRLVDYRLMLREGNQYLSLAVDLTRRRAPQGAAQAATF
jgi:hypothetical protein